MSQEEGRELDQVQQSSQEQFGRQSHRYGKGHILENVEDVAAAGSRLQGLPQTADVLDIATGAGHTGLYFAALGHRVTLADLTQAMLDRALELAAERRLHVSTQLHPAEQFPNGENSFDLVTCRVAAHHFSSPDQFTREAARVLRPGGYFLLIDGSVPDNHPVAEEWIHQVEKYRDPSHNRFLAPARWRALCGQAGLTVVHCELTPLKQPDLNWYFETANTSPENRAKVLELVSKAPAEAKAAFALTEEAGKVVWWWPRITLVARKGTDKAG